MPTLRTDRFLLREITDSDLGNIFLGLSDPAVIKYYGVSYESLEAAKEQMSWFADEKQLWWAICSPDNQTFYGAGGLNDINKVAGKAEIGLWLLPAFWGKGIMREVLPVISNYGFQQLQLNRIEDFINPRNINCKKAMAKLDFRYESTQTEYDNQRDEEIKVEVYAKVKEA